MEKSNIKLYYIYIDWRLWKSSNVSSYWRSLL